MKEEYTVLAIVEAKVGQEELLKQALGKVAELSRTENTCLAYRLHQDLNNPTQFFFYETWESKEAHQAQFGKPYIQELATQLESLLTKPYQVIFAQEI
ncbi:hypothetical protein IM40_01890 [Candidatus Paracaedimonas acanthamoebae]|nr:hypothetical protein IM40_01890 [Candidatus Paracaedimonas acanthamoebae]